MHAWLERTGKPLGGFERSHFYSDSHNDIPLLSVVTHPVATNPNAALPTRKRPRLAFTESIQ
jgi:phosphoserine phosphatase